MQVHIDCISINKHRSSSFLRKFDIHTFREFVLSFHTLVVSLNTHIDQLSMELVCEQLL
jgi:hypothetical protein